jgi:hypothetical protein
MLKIISKLSHEGLEKAPLDPLNQRQNSEIKPQPWCC